MIFQDLEMSRRSCKELFSYYLVDVIQVGSLIGPVVVALLRPALDKRRQHNNNYAAVLPNHLQTERKPSETRGGTFIIISSPRPHRYRSLV